MTEHITQADAVELPEPKLMATQYIFSNKGTDVVAVKGYTADQLRQAIAADRAKRTDILPLIQAYGAACRVSGTGPEVQEAWQAILEALK